MKFNCKICHKAFNLRFHFKQHWLASHSKFEDTEWKNMYDFVEAPSVNVTGVIKHGKVTDINCNDCAKSFPTHWKLKRHWLACHSKQGTGNDASDNGTWQAMHKVKVNKKFPGRVKYLKKFKCKNCLSSFHRISNFKRHWLHFHEISEDVSNWRDMYDYYECEVGKELLNVESKQVWRKINPEFVKMKKFKCKTCRKVYSRKFNFHRHWLDCHSATNEPEDNTWKGMFEITEVEVKRYSHEKAKIKKDSKSQQRRQRLKRIKCKTCHKVLPRHANFKRHWLAKHSEKSLEDDRWKDMIILLDVQVKSENQTSRANVVERINKVVCKRCAKMLNQCDFHRHWNACHSINTDAGREMNEMYDCLTLEVERISLKAIQEFENDMGKRWQYRCKECQAVFRSRNSFKRHWLLAHFREDSLFNESTWKVMYECILREADVESTIAEKRFKCNTCSKMFSTSFNLKRHRLSKHPEEFVDASKIEEVCKVKASNMDTSNMEKKCESPPIYIKKPRLSTHHGETVSLAKDVNSECEIRGRYNGYGENWHPPDVNSFEGEESRLNSECACLPEGSECLEDMESELCVRGVSRDFETPVEAKRVKLERECEEDSNDA